MYSCPKMKMVIGELCAKHGLDLTQQGAHIRLDMAGFDRLCIEVIFERAVSVAHYFEMNGDLVAEPDIVFFIDTQGYWIPVEITQSMTGSSRVVEFNDDVTKILRYQPARQADIARFAELWADNIRAQGWLEDGQPHIYPDLPSADDDLPPWETPDDPPPWVTSDDDLPSCQVQEGSV